MKTFAVKLFVLGLPPKLQDFRIVEIDAETQEQAEQIAHDKYVSDGWGVYDSEEL